jgi:hypothetical protein
MTKQNNRVMTPPFRAAFPSLFEASEYEGKKTYGVEAVFPEGTDLDKLRKVVARVRNEKWDKNVKNIKLPFLDGDDYNEKHDTVREELKGATFLRLRTTNRPDVVDISRQTITDETEVYSGCWMRATIYCFAYDRPGSRGVSFILNNVQKIKDDEPWGAPKISAYADFDDDVSQTSEAQNEFTESTDEW